MATLNIRDFDDELHRQLKVQAAQEGTSIKGLLTKIVRDYLKGIKEG